VARTGEVLLIYICIYIYIYTYIYIYIYTYMHFVAGAYGWLPASKIKDFEGGFQSLSKSKSSKIFIDQVGTAIRMCKGFKPEGWDAAVVSIYIHIYAFAHTRFKCVLICVYYFRQNERARVLSPRSGMRCCCVYVYICVFIGCVYMCMYRHVYM